MDSEMLNSQKNTDVENVNQSDKISIGDEMSSNQTEDESSHLVETHTETTYLLDSNTHLVVNEIKIDTVGSLLVVKDSQKQLESESEGDADEDYAPHELELHEIMNKFNYDKSDSDQSSSESEHEDNVPLAKIQTPLSSTLDNSKQKQNINQEVLSKLEKKPIVYLKRLEDLKVFALNVKKINPSYCLKRILQESKPKLTNIREIDRCTKKDKKKMIMVCNKINEMNRGDKNSLDVLIKSCLSHDDNEASNIVDLTDEPEDTNTKILLARPNPRLIQLVGRNEMDTYFVDPNGKILSQSNMKTEAAKFVDIVNGLMAKIYICCWYKREQKLKELLDKKLISCKSYAFMRKKHNCKLNYACICCIKCKTRYLIRPKVANRIVLSKEPRTFLKSKPLTENPEMIICDDDIKPDGSECNENSFISNSIKYMKSRERISENNNEFLTLKTVNDSEGIKSCCSESYELGPKGDIKEYNVKINSPVANALDFSGENKLKPNVDHDICCWNKRELLIQRMIASNAPLSTILFLKRKHLCPYGNCRCCCQQVPQRHYNCKVPSEQIRPRMEHNKVTLLTDKPKCVKEIDQIPTNESFQDIDKEIKRLLGLKLKHSANGYAKRSKNKNFDEIDDKNLKERIDSLFNCILKEIDDKSPQSSQFKKPAVTSDLIRLKERNVTEALSSSSNENSDVEVPSKVSSDTLVNAVIHDLLGHKRFVKPVAKSTSLQNINLKESLKKAMASIEGFKLIINKKSQVKAQMKIPASELSPGEISLLNSVIKMSQELVVKHNIKTNMHLRAVIESSDLASDTPAPSNAEQHISVIKFNHTSKIKAGKSTITILPPSVLNKLSNTVQNIESEKDCNVLVKATAPPLAVAMLPTVRTDMGKGLNQVKTTPATHMPEMNANIGTITILPPSVLNKLCADVQNVESQVNCNIVRTNKSIDDEPAALASAIAPSSSIPTFPKSRTNMGKGLSLMKTTPTTTATHMPEINAKIGTITILTPSVLNKLSAAVENTESKTNCNIGRKINAINKEAGARTSATAPSTSIPTIPKSRTDMGIGLSQVKTRPTTTATHMPEKNANNGTITVLPPSVLNRSSIAVDNIESKTNCNIERKNRTINEEPAVTTSTTAHSTSMPILAQLKTDMGIGLNQLKTTSTTTATHMPQINGNNGTITVLTPSVINRLSAAVENIESKTNCNIGRNNKAINEELVAAHSTSMPILPKLRADMGIGLSQVKTTTTTSVTVPLISVRKDMGIPLSQMKPTDTTSTILPSISNPRISTISPPPLINFTAVAPDLEMIPKIVSVQSMKENVNNNQPNTSCAKIIPRKIVPNIDNIHNGSLNDIPTYTITINNETQNINILENKTKTLKRKASVRKDSNNGEGINKKRILNHDLR